jgi:hypothetical protein
MVRPANSGRTLDVADQRRSTLMSAKRSRKSRRRNQRLARRPKRWMQVVVGMLLLLASMTGGGRMNGDPAADRISAAFRGTTWEAVVAPITAAADRKALAPNAAADRISAAFQDAPEEDIAAPIAAAAWARLKGKLFTVAACIEESPPRLACGEMVSAHQIKVTTIQTGLSQEGSTEFKAATRLEGDWRGEGFRLQIDPHRAQANFDPSAPFEWKRFVVSGESENSVMFVLGAELFQARLSKSRMLLTSTAFRGEREMVRYRS